MFFVTNFANFPIGGRYFEWTKIDQAKLQYWAGMIRDCQHSGLKTKEWLANHGISKDTLFLFCGKKNNRIKGLLWEGDGFLLLYKRLEVGAYSWPRNTSEALEITPQQYRLLMEGFSIVAKHPITELTNPPKGL